MPKDKKVSLTSKHKDMDVKVALDAVDFNNDASDSKSNLESYIES